MITLNKHKQILADDGCVFRVDWPITTFHDVEIPASHEHFATRQAAEKQANSMPGRPGCVTIVRAADFDPWKDF